MATREFREFMKVMAANDKKLNGCTKPHRFQSIGSRPDRRRCDLCGGEVSVGEAVWYAEGCNNTSAVYESLAEAHPRGII